MFALALVYNLIENEFREMRYRSLLSGDMECQRILGGGLPILFVLGLDGGQTFSKVSEIFCF